MCVCVCVCVCVCGGGDECVYVWSLMYIWYVRLVPLLLLSMCYRERICYRTVVDAESFTCNATRRSVFPKNVNFRRGQAKIYSPGTRGQEEYRDRQVCNYNAFCPENNFLHYQILTPFFEVESSNDGTCIDFIDLVNLDSVCDPPLSNELICGQLPQRISCRRPGNINLDFNFRSNEGVAMAGFRMDVLCASTENATFSLSRRRRRQVPTVSCHGNPMYPQFIFLRILGMTVYYHRIINNY